MEKIEISEMEKFLEKHELQNVHSDVLERIITLVIAAFISVRLGKLLIKHKEK